MVAAPAELLNMRGWVHQEVYDLAESARLNEECSRVAHDLGEIESEANALVNLGVDHMWLGDLVPAEDLFAQAWDLLEKQFGGFRWRWKTRLLAAWGELRLSQGQVDQALDYAEQCLELARKTSSRKNLVKGYKLKGEALATTGRLQEAAIWIAKAAHLAEKVSNPPLIWKSHYALGEVLDRQEHRQQAQAEYALAATIVMETATGLADPHLRETFLDAGPVRSVLNAAGRLQG